MDLRGDDGLRRARRGDSTRSPVLVLDRPNPIDGEIVEGPVLDSSLAYAGSQSDERWAQPTALYPIPLRHGMTMGELAKFYNEVLELQADLHVIPMQNWRRSRWYDKTGLPWVNPSPNMTSLTSATLYPGIVLLESANVSVGRGTPVPFQWVGAPWMDAKKVIDYLDDRPHPGVKFSVETLHAEQARRTSATAGKTMKGIRITIVNRDRAADDAPRRVARVGDQEDAPGFVQGGLVGLRAPLRARRHAGAHQRGRGSRPDRRRHAAGDGGIPAAYAPLPDLPVARARRVAHRIAGE